MIDNGSKLDFGETRANWRNSALARKENITDDALIAAHEVLQTINTPEAKEALGKVNRAIKAGRVLERQGMIVR